MAWTADVLVVANITAPSDELLSALQRIAQRAPTRFTLVVPASRFKGGLDHATASLEEALARLRQAGLDAEGRVGDSDPCVAVSETYDPRRFDEIVVCTLPLGSSKWLHAGLPERIAKLTGAPVTHVVAPPPPPAAGQRSAAATAKHPNPLGPLLAPYAVLGHSETRH